MHLLLTTLCEREQEWNEMDVSMIANAVAHFYIYHPRFWRLAERSLPTHVWNMTPLDLSNLISAMARVDRRDPKSLMLIARRCRRCVQRSLFSQETLATTINAFAKLDFNHKKLSTDFEAAVEPRLDQAIAMGSKYRSSSLRDVDVFDVQALVLLLHTLACLVGTSDEILEKLLTLVSWSAGELGNYQRRLVKIVIIVLRKTREPLFRGLDRDVRDVLYVIEHTPAQVESFESRWVRELATILRKMNITVEWKTVVDDQISDILLPTSQAVVYAVGPYGYYASSTVRTAYSKLHQRLLEMSGYTCLVVPYFEWSELKTEEDKMVYLWSMGRRAAVKEPEKLHDDARPTVVESDLQSDLSDIGEHEIRP